MKTKHFIPEGCTVTIEQHDNTLNIGLSNKSINENNFNRKKSFKISTGRCTNNPIRINNDISDFELNGKNFHRITNKIVSLRNPIDSYIGEKKPSRMQSSHWKETLSEFKNLTELISREEWEMWKQEKEEETSDLDSSLNMV